MREFLRRAASAACLLLFLVAAYSLGSGRVSVVRVTGGSMYPALRAGDVCVVLSTRQVEPRDVVLLEPPGHASRVLHRVRSVEASSLVTQGDANPVPDFDPVPRDAVLGRVTFVVPVGRAVESLATRLDR
jgi:signal peptidase I